MFKKFVAGGVVVVLLAGVAGGLMAFHPAHPEDVVVDEANSGGSVELAEGQTLEVRLAGNYTTGYSWEVVSESAALRLIGEDYLNEGTMPGSGGTAVFRFEATEAGQAQVEIIYHRPWEEGVEPIETFTLDVTIK